MLSLKIFAELLLCLHNIVYLKNSSLKYFIIEHQRYFLTSLFFTDVFINSDCFLALIIFKILFLIHAHNYLLLNMVTMTKELVNGIKINLCF